MSVRVRVKNFQSIKDAEILIDGLAVVTGPNNSGKTSLLRAISGLFTNAPAGPLVRHGEAFLSVELSFSDGTTILWEKGWEKPGRKGGTVNRYTVNGVLIRDVGRGVPPEVEALGVRQIDAGSDKIWPQIAQQFDGTLFLVNRPGSAIAEALSDVERVGRLTSALKLSEKDKRTAESDLKIRREDVKSLTKEVEFYDGMDLVSGQVEAIDITAQAAMLSFRELEEVSEFCRKHEERLASFQALQGFDPYITPSGQVQEVRDMGDRLREILSFQTRLSKSLESVSAFHCFSSEVPITEEVLQAQGVLQGYRDFSVRLGKAQKLVEKFSVVRLPDIPDPERTRKLALATSQVSALAAEYRELTLARDELSLQGEDTEEASKRAAEEVHVLLGDRGICPTCETIHSPESPHP